MAKFQFIKKQNTEKLPKTNGVYCFKKSADFLYIGKAINIKERVKNHLQSPVFKDAVFLPQTDKIGYIKTNSEIEALLLEAQMIKKFLPKYNTVWRDGKSHLYVFITKEKFSRVFVGHKTQMSKSKCQIKSKIQIGPFVDSKALRQTLRLLRQIFPYRTCKTMPKRPCLYKELGLCPAPCVLKVQNSKLKKAYQRNIKNLIFVLQGKKQSVSKNLRKEMQTASKEQNFEKAKILRDQVFALEKVFANAQILQGAERLAAASCPEVRLRGRIEGYDISNIQGKMATGGLVVFENGAPYKSQYRKFKIKLKDTPDDTAMLKEVLQRRLEHTEWQIPQVILIDGGKAQLNIAIEIKYQMSKSKCQIKSKIQMSKMMALAKRNNELFVEGKKEPILLKNLPQETANLILRVRDEAHRFALSYHKKLRSKKLINSA